MRPPRNYRVYLEDIRDAIGRIDQYAVAGERTFFVDEKTQDAVIRQISIIGEAASRIPSAWKTKFAEIPWKKVTGMRNILVHDYSDTDIERVWRTVRSDLPPLNRTVIRMLSEFPEQDGQESRAA